MDLLCLLESISSTSCLLIVTKLELFKTPVRVAMAGCWDLSDVSGIYSNLLRDRRGVKTIAALHDTIRGGCSTTGPELLT
jgi:hypothetical protein